MYQTAVIRFTGCVCILQNEYFSIVKSFKYDYQFVELLGRWVSGWWLFGCWVGGHWFGDRWI